MLELPITIRAPRPDEMPHRPDLEELLEKRKEAHIVEGFIMRPNTTPQLPFLFYAGININNSRLWELLKVLSDELPEEICLEYGLSEQEPVRTEYFPQAVVWQRLAAYRSELTRDCFIEFSLISHNRKTLTEIRVTASKYISYFGSEKEKFLQCMEDFKLPLIRDLAFTDEYPQIVEPLKVFVPAAKRPEEVILGLDRAFNMERG